ncbi:MAG: acyltransferase [Lentisphaerae bacterium]|nr:acyltransferase [Lentisphaerota bacterium]
MAYIQSIAGRIVSAVRAFAGSRNVSARSRLDACGENSVVSGWVDRHVPGGRIEVGRDCSIHGTLKTATPEARIAIGNNVFIAGHTMLDCICGISIEDDVLVSYECIISDSDHHSLSLSVRANDNLDWRREYHDWTTTANEPVRICRGAWLGARVIVLKGVTIGEGSVVGAGSVVTKDVPPWCVAAGNPARVIREIPENER